MPKLNIIQFKNPPLTYSGLPHAYTMIYKPKKEVADVSGIDYIHRPRINWQHYAKVLEAKMKHIFKPKSNPYVRSVVYP